MINNRIYSFLGIATKAGKVVTGNEICERVIKGGKAFLVIVADDASQNTKMKFSNMCSQRGVDLRFYGSKELIGKYTGKEIRSVAAILEQGFADRLKQLIDESFQ